MSFLARPWLMPLQIVSKTYEGIGQEAEDMSEEENAQSAPDVAAAEEVPTATANVSAPAATVLAPPETSVL